MFELRKGYRNQSRAGFETMCLSKQDSECHKSLQLGVPSRGPSMLGTVQPFVTVLSAVSATSSCSCFLSHTSMLIQ